MRIEYEKETNTAYIYVKEEIKPGEARRTNDTIRDLLLDFDVKGRLLGIEILDAKKLLGRQVLARAIRQKSMFGKLKLKSSGNKNLREKNDLRISSLFGTLKTSKTAQQLKDESRSGW